MGELVTAHREDLLEVVQQVLQVVGIFPLLAVQLALVPQETEHVVAATSPQHLLQLHHLLKKTVITV